MKQLAHIIMILFSATISAQSKEVFCKKWHLKGYIYLGITFSPEEKEKNDYINFKTDNTFTTIDEGIFSEGIWKWDKNNKTIYLNNSSSKESLPMKLIKLSRNQLTVLLKGKKHSIKVIFETRNEEENHRD